MLNEMTADHDDDAVIRALGAEAKASPIDRTFLSRVKSRLAIDAERRTKAADAARAKADAEYNREMQAGYDALTPEQQAKADEARAGVADLVRSM